MKFIDHCDKCGILPRHPVAGEHESEHRPVAGQKLRRAQKNLVDSFDLGLFYTGNSSILEIRWLGGISPSRSASASVISSGAPRSVSSSRSRKRV
jgi:hypothetical protein